MSSQVDELSRAPVRAPSPSGAAERPASDVPVHRGRVDAPRPVRGLRGGRVGARLAELGRFSLVGTAAFLVDLALFNLLRFGPWETLTTNPLEAKAIAVTVAAIVSWLGSRYWTFSDRRTTRHGRELMGFLLVNATGMAISVGCLAFTTSVLGLTSPLAENVSANVVGLALANVFRYVAYRRLVFTGDPAGGAPGYPGGSPGEPTSTGSTAPTDADDD